jgi:ABC-2 type transport system ATP-binding protein
MLKVVGLSKSFPKHDAVKDVSFEVKAGEIVGLLGANGAGKTTTMRAIAGLLKPDEGRAEIDGADVQKNPSEAKRRLAYLPDDPSVFPNVSCWEHAAFYASIYEVPDWEKRAEELFGRFDLLGKKHELPSSLSKGMRQRLGLICSFLHSPRLLVLDEPMTGLDPQSIRILNDLLRAEAAGGMAVVVSSHLLSYLSEVCTRYVVLGGGRKLAQGTLEEIAAAHGQGAVDATLESVFLHVIKAKETAA